MGVGIARKIPVAERRTKAVQMRLAGVAYAAIADQLGYASAGAASKDVTRAMRKAAEAEQMAGEELLKVEIDRLDRLMAGLWTRACGGDVKAVEQCEKLIYRRCQLLGLDLINRNGVGDGDVVSLLGTLFAQMQARASADMNTIDVEAVDEIEGSEQNGEPPK